MDRAEVALLQSRVRTCTACRLCTLRQGFAVPVDVGERYEPGGVLLLSERPGSAEGNSGVPMKGGSGQLLDRLLRRAGMPRQEVAISNRLRCRPPEDRTDEVPEALFACQRNTEDELKVLQPGVVVLMGKVAMQLIFGPDIYAGQFRRVARQKDGVTYLGTYHPAHALRHKRVAILIEADLVLARELRDEAALD